MLFNAGAAVLTGGGLGWLAQSCAAACLGHLMFFIAWGVFGIASGVFLLRRSMWALWGGAVFFLIQALALRTNGFAFNLDVGVTFFLSFSSGGWVVSFNLVAWIAMAILLSEYFRQAQARPSYGTRVGAKS